MQTQMTRMLPVATLRAGARCECDFGCPTCDRDDIEPEPVVISGTRAARAARPTTPVRVR
jgi:hypothetical protein